MQLLYSDVIPVEARGVPSFRSAFEKCLKPATAIKMATGYVSEDSLMELKSILAYYQDKKIGKQCDLVIGMHGLEGFTRTQYDAAYNLGKYLRDQRLGEVRVCTAFKFHGKIYSFINSGNPSASIIGSSNLSNILGAHIQWETDVMFTEVDKVTQLLKLHDELVSGASKTILEYEPRINVATKGMLEGAAGVERASFEELEKVRALRSNVTFEIPLKAEPKSNLNTFFGKGRENKTTGVVRPRPWYEVEIIVPLAITSKKDYPSNDRPFTVYTNDGWKFQCVVNGQNKKNLRSEADLQTLGRWIKGHLEASGVLKVGDLVTEEMLAHFGTNKLKLSATKDPNTWLLDFTPNS